MSMYGDIKKIGSSTFQFDRVYNTRFDMDAAAATDGVYAGRYVLVEYGERFNFKEDGSAVEPGTAVFYSGQPNIYYIHNDETDENLVQVTENNNFKTRAETDLQAYGAIYDSTVWQKIYAEGKDRYIMVAELNAMAPKLDFQLMQPVQYTRVTDEKDATAGLFAGGQNADGEIEIVRLANAQENYNKPYFDTAIDTELTYLMHQPMALNLKIDNDTIEYNRNGFNMAYSFGEKAGVSAVAWVPLGLDYQLVKDKEGEQQYDAYNNPLANITKNQDIDTKMLYMSFPALGNAMNALYNLLYGEPDEGDLTHGALRPYFKQFLSYIKVTAPVTVNDVPLLVDGKNVYVSGYPGQEIDVLATVNDIGKPVTPEGIKIYYYDAANGTFIDPTTMTPKPTTNLYYCYDTEPPTTVVYKIPEPNGENDNLEWMKDIPELSNILANNTTGLATVLSSLFGYADPFTGQTRYYLYNDWLTADTVESSGPAIANKPKVIGGYETTFTDKVEQLADLGNGGTATTTYRYTDIITNPDFSGGDYFIDFTSWQLVDHNVNVTGA